MNGFPYARDPVPYLTMAQMVEVDRAMIEDYGISLLQMMENAGRCLAHLARSRFLGGDPRGRRVVVLAGTGGNGGGAMVAARSLHNYGARPEVLLTRPEDTYSAAAALQLTIVHRLGIPVRAAGQVGGLETPELILDGLIGYSLQGAPRGPAADLIHWANDQATSVLALDVPSGLDTTAGTIHDPAIRAIATLTLALPKEGLGAEDAAALVGELYLADISVPPELYASLGLRVGSVFHESDIVRLA